MQCLIWLTGDFFKFAGLLSEAWVWLTLQLEELVAVRVPGVRADPGKLGIIWDPVGIFPQYTRQYFFYIHWNISLMHIGIFPKYTWKYIDQYIGIFPRSQYVYIVIFPQYAWDYFLKIHGNISPVCMAIFPQYRREYFSIYLAIFGRRV